MYSAGVSFGNCVAIAVSGLTAPDMCLFTPLTNDIFLSASSRRYSVGRRLWDSFSLRGTAQSGTDISLQKLIKGKKAHGGRANLYACRWCDMCAQRFCFRQYRQRTVFVLYTVGVLKNTGYDTLRRRQRKACADNKPSRR